MSLGGDLQKQYEMMANVKKCEGGKHSLINLYQAEEIDEGYIFTDVVMWCEYCGAIAIDKVTNHRLVPGGLMKMRFPKFVLENVE